MAAASAPIAIAPVASAPIQITGLTMTPVGTTDAKGHGLFLPELSLRIPLAGGKYHDTTGPLGDPHAFRSDVQIAVEFSRFLTLNKGRMVLSSNYDMKFKPQMQMSPASMANCNYAERMREKKRREEAAELMFMSERKEFLDLVRAANRLHKRRPELLNDPELTGRLVVKEAMEMGAEGRPVSYSPRPRMRA